MSESETPLVMSLLKLGALLLPSADADDLLEGPRGNYADTIFSSEFGQRLKNADTPEEPGLLSRASLLAHRDIAAALFLVSSILEGAREAKSQMAVRRLRNAARLWNGHFIKTIGRKVLVGPPQTAVVNTPGLSKARFTKRSDIQDPPESTEPENQILGPPVLAHDPQRRGRGDNSVNNFARLAQPFPRIKRPDHELLEIALVQHFPWLAGLIQRYLAPLIHSKNLRRSGFFLPPTLISGAPGVGKSELAQFIGAAAGVPTKNYNAAASFEASDFTGLNRSWAGAAPGLPIRAIKETEIANPIVVVDEIDKIASSNVYGRITDALLTMLEPSTARNWRDPYLEVEADISQITWIVLTNDPGRLPGPLLSRLRVLTAPGPSGSHAPHLILQWRKAAANEAGRPVETLPDLPPEAIALLTDDLEQRRDLRRLKRAFISLMTAVPWPEIH